jgi:hypothetical protein
MCGKPIHGLAGKTQRVGKNVPDAASGQMVRGKCRWGATVTSDYRRMNAAPLVPEPLADHELELLGCAASRPSQDATGRTAITTTRPLANIKHC